MIKTLRIKFIFINMLLVFSVLLVVFAAIATVSIWRIRIETNISLGAAIEGRVFTIAQTGSWPGRANSMIVMRQAAFLAIIRPDGRIDLAGSADISKYEDYVEDIVHKALGQNGRDSVLKEYGLKYMVKSTGGETRIAFADLSYENEAIREAVLFSGLAMALTLGAFFIISLFLSKWALLPAERAWEQQKRFISDASHELKTPITVILANMGILKSNPQAVPDDGMKWIDNTRDEALDMKELVDQLLFLAKHDGGEAKTVSESVNLSDTALNIALSMESVAFEKGVSIETEIGLDIYVKGDREQLKSLVKIMLDNAVKYSEGGEPIRISLNKEGSRARLLVSNGGAGISPENLPHIWDRFYRTDFSRHKEGYGLGLPIAKRIVLNHGGAIEALSACGLTEFRVSLPVAAPNE